MYFFKMVIKIGEMHFARTIRIQKQNRDFFFVVSELVVGSREQDKLLYNANRQKEEGVKITRKYRIVNLYNVYNFSRNILTPPSPI